LEGKEVRVEDAEERKGGTEDENILAARREVASVPDDSAE